MGERKLSRIDKSESGGQREPGLWTDGEAGFALVTEEGYKYVIPSQVILERAADYVRRERVGALERSEDATILGVPILGEENP